MKANNMPDHGFLSECFSIDSNSPTGLVWNKRPREHFIANKGFVNFSKNFAGKAAGDRLSDYGYWRVGVKHNDKNLRLLCHRIIYSIYHKIELPKSMWIDHIDRNPMNNCIENLRLVTPSQNNRNRGAGANNTSGTMGVGFNKRRNKWCASITVEKKVYSLGSFDSIESAVAARKHAENFTFKNN